MCWHKEVLLLQKLIPLQGKFEISIRRKKLSGDFGICSTKRIMPPICWDFFLKVLVIIKAVLQGGFRKHRQKCISLARSTQLAIFLVPSPVDLAKAVRQVLIGGDYSHLCHVHCISSCARFSDSFMQVYCKLGKVYRIHHSHCKTWPKSCFFSIQRGWYKCLFLILNLSRWVMAFIIIQQSLKASAVVTRVTFYIRCMMHRLLPFTQALTMIRVFCYCAPLVSFSSVPFFAGYNGLCHIQGVLLFHQAPHLLLFPFLTFLTHSSHYSCSYCASRRQWAKTENR